MSKPVKRSPKRAYSSVVRQEQALQTRTRILEAAGELFASQGYARTTIRAIATAADVAPDTVYATFRSKARVLTALIDLRLAPASGVGNVMDRPEAQAVRDEVDQRAQLHRFATDIAAVSTRVRPVYEIMRGAAVVEPEMAAVFAEMEDYRLANMRRVAEWIAARGPLRVTIDEAAETIWVLAGPDTARALCDVRGWGEAEYAAWLEHLLVRGLLADGD
jgi:AcrR family transcriptional regulator